LVAKFMTSQGARIVKPLVAKISLPLIGFASWPAAAVELAVTPSADSTVFFSGDAATGASSEASNARGENLSVSQDAGGIVRRALIRFDLSSIAPAAVVQSAELALFSTRSRGDYDVTLHRLLRGWGEGPSNGGSAGASGTAGAGDATWMRAVHPNIAWDTPGGDFVPEASASTFVGNASRSYAWSSSGMVADVQSWIDMPGTNHGWLLLGVETQNQNAKLFGSRESGVMPPLTLQVTPVPEPTSYALLLAGLGLVGWAARRRNRVGAQRPSAVARPFDELLASSGTWRETKQRKPVATDVGFYSPDLRFRSLRHGPWGSPGSSWSGPTGWRISNCEETLYG
jgi:hypothetical protein